MSTLPSFAIHVADLGKSIAFYRDHLEFTLVEIQPDANVATMLDADGDLMLLAGPSAGDLTPLMSEGPIIFKPGETLGYHGGNLEALRAELQQRGVEHMQLSQSRFGDKQLRLQDPDGYILSFISPVQRSQEEELALYARMPGELDDALAGLTEADLDLSKKAGEWGIRQIIHHIADGEILFMNGMRAALLAPGKIHSPPIFGGNYVISATFDYANRAVEPSVELSRSIHNYVSQLAWHVADSWERSALGEAGRQVSFGQLVGYSNRHAGEHIDEIYEIRRIHGK